KYLQGHFTKRSGGIEGGSHKLGDSESKNTGGEVPHCVAPSALRVTWALRPGTVTKLEPRSISEAEKTPLELETSTPAAIVGEIVAACGSGGTIGWAGAENITHAYWTGT